MDHGRLPAWKRGMDLAHSVCAAVADGSLARTDAGKRLRSAAVSVPSLVGDAFLDLSGPDAGLALSQAAEKLSEVARLLSLEAVGQSLGEAERSGLLTEVESLRAELLELRGSLGPASSH
jgi:hypothetical protein